MRPDTLPASPRSGALRRITVLAIACFAMLASGCVYRMTIQQGNFLDPEQVDQLEAGMMRSQVMFLLGTPMVPPAFNNDRWDYYYHLDATRPKVKLTRRLIVYFEEDKVSRFDRTEMPSTAPPVTVNPG